MPDVVNEDLGALAAEFVLGTLDSDERARVNELLDRDDQFRAMVRTWERRLGELHLMVEPVEPPEAVWDRIEIKIEAAQPTSEIKPPEAPAPAGPTTLGALEAELRKAGNAGAEPAADRPPETGTPAVSAEALTSEAVTPPLVPAAVVSPVSIAADRLEQPLPEPPGREVPRDSYLSVRRWRLAAVMMTIVAAALASLVAAWRYAPERLPPQLRAAHFLNMRIPESPPAPVRPPPPSGSQFDE